MKRIITSLNGEWLLNNEPIQVPYPPESKLSAYQKEVPEEFVLTKVFSYQKIENTKVILHFGAIDQIAHVYLNDQFLIEHIGGYLSFKVDITDFIQEENNLKVEVIDHLDRTYPYGKQSKNPSGMWYTQVSGIWKDVYLEEKAIDSIDHLIIESDLEKAHLHFDDSISLHQITIHYPNGDYTESFQGNDYIFEPSSKGVPVLLWSPEEPNLYEFELTNGKDEIKGYFALRKYEVKNNLFYLNDQPYLLEGVLDQGYFEDGIYTPKQKECFKEDITHMKELGFNTLRKHIKVEHEAFYEYCNRLGMLVFQDMVNSGEYHYYRDTVLPTFGFQKKKDKLVDPIRKEFFVKHCLDTIAQLRNHPCIIAYTIYNEGWGQQEVDDVYDMLKKQYPDILFNSTSGWFAQHNSDFDSKHIYFRNKVLHQKEKPLLLSECGGYIRQMEKTKVKSWGYGKTDSEKELTDKFERLYKQMILPSIKNNLTGFVITQLSDVENEKNGFYTYDRSQCKVNISRFQAFNQKAKEAFKQEH